MIIREAIAADLEAVVALLADDQLGRARETPGDLAYAEAFERMRRQGDNLLLVAEDEAGDILACLQLTLIHGLSRQGASRAQIEGVRVSDRMRGAGLGRRMIEAAVTRAEQAGCALAQLTTDRQRPEAHRFYESLGFEPSHVGYKRNLRLASAEETD
ncbi:MAG: GNAT family N-acetyltransferase [Rhodobacteraceae bacterium]|nr:GNAT family N-acetyltransferase [Paracoccaceae bacterium]